ncbi:MAG: hypothetical protein HYS35_09000 [Betaproteobacteria bacterium]|nr:hypothetical protein [Betaproteobacteria bacterium]
MSEWFWRFLAAVMLFAVGWAMWIFYQLNAPPLVTSAAFEAAAKAKAAQSARGRIAPAPRPAEPPVNVEKLRLSDTITAPEPESADRK